VPDEFNEWVKKTRFDLETQFKAIDKIAHIDYDDIITSLDTQYSRKDFALLAIKRIYPALLFGLYDNKPIEYMIWKSMKPEYSKPFKKEV